MIENLRCEESGSGTAFPRGVGELPIITRRRSGLRLSSFVLVLLSPYVVLRREYVQKLLFAVVILDIPFQLGTTFFHRPADAELGAFKGLSISATTLALVGLYASWFMAALADRNVRQRPSLHINRPLTVYLAFVTLSLLVAQDVSLGLFELFLFLQLYLVFLYVANTVRNRQDILFIVSLLLIGGLVESIVIIVLRFTNMESTVLGPVHIFTESGANGEWIRVGGTIGVPNIAGAYLSILLAIAACLLFSNLGRAYKGLAVALLGLGEVALIFTFSRGAWIALVIAIGGLGLVVWRQRRLSFKLPIAIFAILMLLYLPFHDAISARLFGDDNGSAESRIPLMNLASRIIEDNPVLGVGANNFTLAMERYLTPEFRNGRTFLFAVHNKYLLVWAETGIGALLAFIAFLLGTLRRGWQCWRFQDRLLSPLALGITAGIAGHMVHLTVDHFRSRPTQQLLWLLAGLLVAMHRMYTTAPCADPFSSIT
ncbi:MAG TPA: O-antigen ligase family protein [Candidatus Acidoferrum sp.]